MPWRQNFPRHFARRVPLVFRPVFLAKTTRKQTCWVGKVMVLGSSSLKKYLSNWIILFQVEVKIQDPV